MTSVADIMFKGYLYCSSSPNGQEIQELARIEGCNPGGKYLDRETGQRYYVKVNSSELHTRLEHFANLVYGLLDIPSATSHLLWLQGADSPHLAIASKMVHGYLHSTPAPLRNHQDIINGFVADCWLRNPDAVGEYYDNIIFSPDGHAYRIDNGCVGPFSATGKPREFLGDTIPELDSVRISSRAEGQVFGLVTEAQMKVQAAHLLRMLNETSIIDILEESGISAKETATLSRIWVGRLCSLRSRFVL